MTTAITITPAARVMQAAENLIRITNELQDAQADAALLKRLSSAQARAKELAADQATALTEQQDALAAEDKAREDARFRQFQGIDVVDVKPDEHVLRSSFAITYSRLAYDMDRGISVPTPTTSAGFNGLPSAILEYLIERHPSKIPAKIMALAPDNPRAAFDRYFLGLRRNYISS